MWRARFGIMKLRRQQYCKRPLPTCVDDVMCVHHSSILFPNLLRKIRHHILKLPKALSSSTKVMLTSKVFPFATLWIRFNTYHVSLVCIMFHWRPQNPGVYMTWRKYSKNNKNDTILVRNNMRKFAEMKSNTKMVLTNLVLKANILIEFSFWFDLVNFLESQFCY